MDLARAMPHYQNLVDYGGELGACYLRLGKYEDALSTFEECDQITEEKSIGKSPVTTRYKNGRLEGLLILAEQAASQDVNAWMVKAREAASTALAQGKVYPPGMPEAMMLHGRLSWLQGDEGQARKWWERSLPMAEEMELKWDLARTLSEIGHRTGDKEQLDRAIDIFTQTDSLWELEKAQKIRSNLT